MLEGTHKPLPTESVRTEISGLLTHKDTHSVGHLGMLLLSFQERALEPESLWPWPSRVSVVDDDWP